MPVPKKHNFSDYFYNRVTYTGVFLALTIFLIECFLFGFDFFSRHETGYLTILTYVILPPFLILGLILIPLGATWKRRRVFMGLAERQPKSLYLDPSIPTHRNAILVFLTGTFILIIMTAVGSYKAFHYTESVHFCGQTCHVVMKPQHTTYLQSPHARVKCVECHIGAGADWYVRSKLSGARQIYHTIKGDYSRPIPTPVHNLRPAKETCEQCHWPGKFYSSFELRRNYYPADPEESGTKNWILRMLIQVGGSENTGNGIHAHMYANNDVYYLADDERRQKITWVKSIDKTGKATIYTSLDSKYKDTAPPPELIRKMDCVDCHNRPSHRYEPPYELVNHAFLQGKIDPEIPKAKSKIMEVLTAEYKSTDDAVRQIREKLQEYYQNKQPDYFQKYPGQIRQLIERTVDMYKSYFFPEMKARWDAYPNNIGHLWSPGCFRCHDGEHTSSDGKTITRDCTVCHAIIEQGPPNDLKSDAKGMPFVHPFQPDDTLWQDMNCFDCHTGN